jgi:hypothetical protein
MFFAKCNFNYYNVTGAAYNYCFNSTICEDNTLVEFMKINDLSNNVNDLLNFYVASDDETAAGVAAAGVPAADTDMEVARAFDTDMEVARGKFATPLSDRGLLRFGSDSAATDTEGYASDQSQYQSQDHHDSKIYTTGPPLSTIIENEGGNSKSNKTKRKQIATVNNYKLTKKQRKHKVKKTIQKNKKIKMKKWTIKRR